MLTALFSCERDNYQPPSVTLSGRLVYKGVPIPLEYNQVPYQLYQYGFGKVGPISQSFTQDGAFSSLLFAGDYKFTIINATVPFKWPQTVAGKPDSLTINLSSDKTMDIEVTPYYMVRDAKISAASNKVNSTFKIEKTLLDASGKNFSRAVLFINKTQFVSTNDNIASVSINASEITDLNNVNLSVNIPSIVPTQNYVFARVGVQIAGINSWVFSPIQKLTF
ncbi:uncharacterized protein DUF3823 [Arcicella aurantiaca]|uniref:Uncharacterized protein DUF3823 n=2 Tax=Arcicella aurantiaca TaxID=591202 RepID=A0A316EC17_9BACT|nr:uncharacterized protein DUF3823 [Arcicella aurantiaca]